MIHPSLHGVSFRVDAETMDSWNPMKDAFKQPSFNSYIRGPGAGIPARIQPANKWIAEGQTNLGQQQSSRLDAIQLFVNYLPVEMNEQSLKTLFSQAGEVLYTRRSRPKVLNSTHTCGFVSFLTLREAEEAIRRFNGYEIGSKRLFVDFAKFDNESKNKGAPMKTVGVEEETLHFANRSLPISEAKKFLDHPFRKDGKPGSSFSDPGHRSGGLSLHSGSESGSPGASCRRFPDYPFRKDGKPVSFSDPGQWSDGSSLHSGSESASPVMPCSRPSNKELILLPAGATMHKALSGGTTLNNNASNSNATGVIVNKRRNSCNDLNINCLNPKNRAHLNLPNGSEAQDRDVLLHMGKSKKHLPAQLVHNKVIDEGNVCGAGRVLTESVHKSASSGSAILKSEDAKAKNSQDLDGEVLWSKRTKLLDMKRTEVEVGNKMLILQTLQLLVEQQFSSQPGHHPISGEVFLGCYSEDRAWYRAVLEDTDATEGMYNVLYIDFGNHETIGADSIRVLPKEFTVLPICAIRCRMTTIPTLQEQGTDDVLKNKFLNHAVHIVFQKFDKEMQTWSVDIGLKDVFTGIPSSSNDPVLPPSTKEIPKSSLVQYGQTIFEEECFLVLISEVVDPSHFYCQRVFGIERLYSLMEEIAVHCEGLGPEGFSPQQGDIVCAQYTEDNKWYRAHLMEFLPGNSAYVFYVDFGTSEALSMSRLRHSKVEFSQLSFQALRCSLAGVKPMHKFWGSDAQTTFKKIVWNRSMKAKVIDGTESGALDVELTLSPDPDERSGLPGSLAQRLVDAGVAKLSIGVAESEHASPSIVADDYTKKWEYSQLPLNESCAVLVTVVDGPSEFYCRLANIAVEQELLNLMEELMTICPSLPSQPIFEPVLNQPYCAQYSVDDLWYRALVAAPCGLDGVPVRYADFGNGESVPMARLRPIPVEYLRLPLQAIRCSLEADPSIAEPCVLRLHEGQLVNVLALACTGPGSYSVRLCNSDSSTSHGGLRETQRCKDVQDDNDFENTRPLSVHAVSEQLTSEQEESVKSGEYTEIVQLMQEVKDQFFTKMEQLNVLVEALEKKRRNNVA